MAINKMYFKYILLIESTGHNKEGVVYADYEVHLR